MAIVSSIAVCPAKAIGQAPSVPAGAPEVEPLPASEAPAGEPAAGTPEEPAAVTTDDTADDTADDTRDKTAPVEQLSGAELRAQGREHFFAGRYAEAIDYYERAIAIQAYDAEAYVLLGEALFALGDTRAAIDAVRRAVALQPENADYRVALGDAYTALGAHRAAARQYDLAVAIDRRAEARRAEAAMAGTRRFFGPGAPGRDVATRRKSYGSLLGAAYVLSPLVFGVTFASIECDNCAPAAALTIFGAPAVVHWAHGEIGNGFLALLGAPASAGAGALAGFLLASDCSGSACEGIYTVVGAVTGYVTWAIIDCAFLAYTEEYVPPRARRGHSPMLMGISPVRGGAAGTVAGRF
jgi:hypothetical protein